MKMKQGAGMRTRLSMKRKMLMIAGAGVSILGLALILTVALNLGNVRQLWAAGTTYYSRAGGAWNNNNTWSTSAYGGSAASSYPKAGDVVNIKGVAITVSAADADAASINMETQGTSAVGTLTIKNGYKLNVSGDMIMNFSSGNNTLLVDVQGTSVLNIGGSFSESAAGGSGTAKLMTEGNAVVNITGNMNVSTSNGASADMVNTKDNSKLNVGGNVNITEYGGTGEMVFLIDGSSTTTVAGNINVNTTGTDASITLSGSSNLVINGNLNTYNNASKYAFLTATSTSTVKFNGTEAQTALGSGSDTLVLGSLEMKNGAGVVLNGPLKVTGTLTMTNGVLYTSATAPLVLSSAAVLGTSSSTSYVSGPMQKQGRAAFTFPLGKNGVYAPIGIASSNNFSKYTAEYFNSPYSVLFANSPLQQVSTYEYWTMNKDYGASSPKVTLFWNTDQSGITNIPKLRVAYFDVGTSKWVDAGNSATTGTNTAGSVTSTTTPAFNKFTFGSTTIQGLPVELTAFNLKPGSEGVEARWTTSSELNNDYFLLERSADGVNFEEVAHVKGHGTTQAQQQYSYMDATPLAGRSYYRLKQVDFNGQSETFKLKTVQMPIANIESVGPNPFTHQFTMQYSLTNNGPVMVQLVNMTGAVTFERQMEGNKGANTFTYSDDQNLKVGTYVLRVIKDGEVVTTKIVKNLQ
jgi:hypothetical protein